RREDLFITTKLWVQDAGYEPARQAFDTSMRKLGLDYLDLYLIHQPVGDYYGSWRAMEELYEAGKVRAIGVSNFYPHVLTDLCLHAKVIPAVNQVELHPFFQQSDALKVMKSFGVLPEAWGPFAEGKHGIFKHPVLVEIGAKYRKTPAQVILRWNVQRGVVVIPKSVHRERIAENFAIWDFVLSGEDMAEISKLDIGHSEIVDHFDPEFVKMISGWKIHE
ncbi:MAG: aldo/keto reductase, partial [Proteobacteria bacterium]|nr:aldo/keto reductase [Pseudomonadota bacterium]